MSTPRAPARARGEHTGGTPTDVVASEAWVRPVSCEPGQRWMCPCGDIRPYIIAFCLGCYDDSEYHLAAAVALHNYADVVAGTPMGATHIGWGTSNPDALAVGEADSIAWGLVSTALDDDDKTALDDAVAAIVTDSALRVLGAAGSRCDAGVRGDLEMILRGLANSHRLAHNNCQHDHDLQTAQPCPRSAT